MQDKTIPWLEPRKNGVYYAWWYDQDAGRTERLSLRTKDPDQAGRRFAAFLTEFYKGTVGPQAKVQAGAAAEAITCDVAFDHYRDEHVAANVVDKDRLDIVLKHLQQHFGHIPVAAVTQEDWKAYAQCRAEGRIGKPSGPGTLRKEGTHLIAAWNHEVRKKRLPADLVPSITLPPAPPAKDRWLTIEELQRLFAAARQEPVRDDSGAFSGMKHSDSLPRIYLFCRIAYFTASRKTAVLTLTRFQVDLANRKIRLNPEGRAQTKKRRPVVPIADQLYPELAAALKATSSEYVLRHTGSIRTAFEGAVDRAGLEDVTPHTLRHTRAVHLAQRGVSLYEIAGLLGDSIETVYRNYLHHCPDHLRGAVNAVDLDGVKTGANQTSGASDLS